MILQREKNVWLYEGSTDNQGNFPEPWYLEILLGECCIDMADLSFQPFWYSKACIAHTVNNIVNTDHLAWLKSPWKANTIIRQEIPRV